MAENTCLQCGEKLTGRADKKFCGDYCRATHHQQQRKRPEMALKRKVHRSLAKNYEILCGLNPDGKKKVHKDELLKRGMELTMCTMVYTTKAGKVYYFTYDQGLLELDNNWYMIVKRFEKDASPTKK